MPVSDSIHVDCCTWVDYREQVIPQGIWILQWITSNTYWVALLGRLTEPLGQVGPLCEGKVCSAGMKVLVLLECTRLVLVSPVTCCWL